MTNEKLAELLNGLRDRTHLVEVFADGNRHVVCWAKGDVLAGAPLFLQEDVTNCFARARRTAARQRSA